MITQSDQMKRRSFVERGEKEELIITCGVDALPNLNVLLHWREAGMKQVKVTPKLVVTPFSLPNMACLEASS
jgi:hypothetical protein